MGINKFMVSFLSAFLYMFSAISYASASGETQLILGDADVSSTVDSADASLILSEYSTISTGREATFNSVQKICADVDRNGAIDSVDASYVLAYYAYIATGGKSNIIDFIDGKYVPVTTATTAATTETTTTTTTTTQSPIVEKYRLEEIRESADAFEYYTEKLWEELYNGHNLLRTFGNSSGYNECKVALALLNYDQGISNDVLSTVFADYTTDEIYEIAYCMDIARVNCEYADEPVDFHKYLLDENLADEINMMNEYYIQASYGDSENFVNQLYNYMINTIDPNSIENYPLFWYYCCSGDTAASRFGLDTECITQEEENLYKNRIDEYCSEFKGNVY